MTVYGQEGSLEDDRNFLNLDCGDVCTTLKITKNHEIVHSKQVNLMGCKLYLNKAILTIKELMVPIEGR